MIRIVNEYFRVCLESELSILVPITYVVEVIASNRRDVCPIPGVVPALLGVINYRGQLLWILKLSDFLASTHLPLSLLLSWSNLQDFADSESDLHWIVEKLHQPNERTCLSEKLTLLIVSANPTKIDTFDEINPKVACLVSQLQGIVTLDRSRSNSDSDITENFEAILEIRALFTALYDRNTSNTAMNSF